MGLVLAEGSTYAETVTPEPIRKRLAATGNEYKAGLAIVARARDELPSLVVEALKAGMTQKEVVELSGYTRETVRQIAAEAGIGPAPKRRRVIRP